MASGPGRGGTLDLWQRQAVLGAAALLRDHFGLAPIDPRVKAVHDLLLEVVDPSRRAKRLQRETATAASGPLTMKSERSGRGRRTGGERRVLDLGAPTGNERRMAERRKSDDRRTRRSSMRSGDAPVLGSFQTAQRQLRKYPEGGPWTVLVVDDDEGLRELARRLLERQGYTVLTAANVNDAMVLCEATAGIDVVLTDVMMPGAGGAELARRLAERRPELKVIYMSGYTDEAVMEHGVLNPGIGFLQKPFTSETLGQKIRETLDRDSGPLV